MHIEHGDAVRFITKESGSPLRRETRRRKAARAHRLPGTYRAAGELAPLCYKLSSSAETERRCVLRQGRATKRGNRGWQGRDLGASGSHVTLWITLRALNPSERDGEVSHATASSAQHSSANLLSHRHSLTDFRTHRNAHHPPRPTVIEQ